MLLVMGTSELHVELIPVINGTNTTGQSLGDILYYPKLYRRRGYNFDQFWGQLKDQSQAPEGSYILKAKALKIFGKRERDEDWDSFQSNWFSFKYVM